MAIEINYIKHGDFSFDDEKVEEIAKNIETVNKKKGVLGKFTSPTARINGDQIIKRRQVLLDPSAIADLNEGDAPRQDSIKIVTFSESTRSVGSYIPFGRHAVKRNRDDVTSMCRRQLAHARLIDIEKIRFIAFDSTTYSADAVYDSTNQKFKWWDTFTNLGIRLDKNKGTGQKVFLCTPEMAADIAREAKESNTLLQGTSDGEKLTAEGYIGDYCGFHIVKDQESYMYKNVTSGSGQSATTTRYQLAFAFTKTEDGTWPIVDTGMGVDPKGEVIVKDLGSAGIFDPTNEVGSIASRIDYVGAYCEHPENIIRIVNVTTGTGGKLAEISGDLPAAYKIAANNATNVGAGRANASSQEVVSPND